MKIKFLILFFSLFLSTSLALKIDKETLSVTTEPTSLTLTIENRNDFDELFLISVFPQEAQGIKTFYNDRIWVKAFSKADVKIFFISSKCIPQVSQVFEISVFPLSKRENVERVRVTAFPSSLAASCISDLKLSQKKLEPGNYLDVSINIKNLASTTKKFFLQVLIDDNNIRDSPREVYVEKFSERMEKFILFFDKYSTPKNYNLKVILKDENNNIIDFREDSFVITEKFNVEQSQETKFSIFEIKVKVSISNVGNVKSEEFQYKVNIPYLMSIFLTSQNKFEREKNSIKWQIPSLNPGSKYEITYSILIYPYWLTALVIILLIVSIYYKYFTIVVIKKVGMEKISLEKDLRIDIHVINTRKKILKDVVLIDKVPSIFKISKKFETLEPEIKKSIFGFELVWNLGDLNPNEERVISYRIRPIVEIVGKFKLPAAILKFREGEKLRKISVSKSVSVST